MLCQKCGKEEACYHKKTITNGVFSEVHLCEKCHDNEENDFAYKLANVANIFSPEEFFDEDIPFLEAERRCDKCGTTYSEFLNSALVGCEKCYEKFKPVVIQMCKNYHGKTMHIENNTDELKEQYVKLYELAMMQNRYEDAKKIKAMLDSLLKEDN